MAENPRESNGYKAKLYEGERVIPARELATGGISGEALAEIIERVRAKPGSDRTAITFRLDVDVSDALTGLKALRREADRAVAALKALEAALGSVSLRHVRVGDYEETEILPLRPEVSE
ncbi:hypothetical protein A6764_15115 [Brevibacillus sp. WF146]|uniref:hypothetical protein n=1 Tax=Brevibacillus sp. WF146 TaxID=319501 RepID=UPI0007ED3A17|nr:hypothetical protein [Brevibacillus sp. WF146]UYZ12155.1 hypothetical protein A6764_15115 [Brevibacillus sp. WF146]